MGERSTLFQVAVIALLLLLAGIGLLIVIQNNDTQKKLEEIRSALDAQSRSGSQPAASSLPANPAAPTATALSTAPQTADTAPGIHPGPDGVGEYTLGGIRVRAQEFRNPAAVDGDSLTRSFGADAKGLNPYIYNEALGSTLFGMCNDSLAARDASDDPERWIPHLATGWTVEQTVRVHLTETKVPSEGGPAAAVLEQLKSEPDAAKLWQADGIASIIADGPATLVLKINTVNNAYAAYLTERLGAKANNSLNPVQYVNVKLEPHFSLPAGEGEPLGLKALLDQGRAWSGAWKVVATQPACGSETEGSFTVLGDAPAFVTKLNDVLKAASPHFDSKDPKTIRGKVDPIDRQPFEVQVSFTFALRQGVHWQSVEDPREGRNQAVIPGPEFTSADVLFTYEKILCNPKVPCEHLRNYLRDLAGISAPDAHTVRFDWARPYFQVFENSAGFLILPRHIFEQTDIDNLERSPFCRMVCGTGPWKFRRWTPGVEIELERNADYWGVKPHLLKYRIQIKSEPTVVLNLFLDGKLDQATLTPDQWQNNVDTPKLREIARKENGIANSYYYIGYNLRKPPFDDVRVRRALTMLIDRTAIIHTIFNDNGVPLTGPFHPLSLDNDPALPPVQYDLAGAVKLLNDAGWKDTDNDGVLDKDGVPLEYDLLYRSARPEHEQIAAMIQQANRKAGIKCNLVVVEWTAFIDRVSAKQDFSACILGWQLPYSSDPYQVWHSSQTERTMSNFVGYKDPVSDELIVQGRYTVDAAARHALYQQLHKRIYDAQPYSFLFVPKRLIVYAKRYEDVKYTLLDSDVNRYWVKPENQRPVP